MNTDEFPVEDVEKLREELLDLAEKGEIKESKVFLKSKKCTEDVMKRIMAEYVEKTRRLSKMMMAIQLVKFGPGFLEMFGDWTGMMKFRYGHDKFSAKILSDENTMSVIAEMMPSHECGPVIVKYIAAMAFLGSLVSSEVILFPEPEVVISEVPEPEPEPEACGGQSPPETKTQ